MAQWLDFAGRRALVVGGSTGIGNAIAQIFRTCGAEVHVTGTRPGPGDYSMADISDLEGLAYSQLDLADPGAISRWRPAFSDLHALILCHGATRYHRAEYEGAAFREIMEINLNSMFDCAERFRGMLRKTGGAIVLVSSVAAFRTLREQPAYTASKAGILGLTRALAADYIKDGINANGLAPGLVETKMGRASGIQPTMLSRISARLPIGRSAEPSEMAGAALFLASPLASYVVGRTLVVDGGMMLL
jgi:3-oxoacyl-[acyl-carrier protein] reductase